MSSGGFPFRRAQFSLSPEGLSGRMASLRKTLGRQIGISPEGRPKVVHGVSPERNGRSGARWRRHSKSGLSPSNGLSPSDASKVGPLLNAFVQAASAGEITRIFDNFQNKHGEINREKIEGLVWLTVVEKLRTQRPISKLGRMVQKQIDDRKVDERQHDLVAGLEQVMKLVELVSVEESKACDTMGLVDLQIKDVEKEIDRSMCLTE